MQLLFDILPWAAGAGTTIGGFFLGRRKSKADAIATELANVEKAIGIYRGITQDLQKEIVQLKASLDKMYQQNKQLIEENKQLKQKMQQLERKLDGMNK